MWIRPSFSRICITLVRTNQPLLDLLATTMSEQINGVAATGQMNEDVDNVDPIWTSSRTARQIHALSAVEKVCAHCIIVRAEATHVAFAVGYQSLAHTGFIFYVPFDIAADGQT